MKLRMPLLVAVASLLLTSTAVSQETSESSSEVGVSSEEASAVSKPRARVVAITANGKQVAAGWQGGLVTLLTGIRGEVVRELEPVLPADPWALDFSPDGHRLAVLDHGGSLRIWDLESGTASAPESAVPANDRMHEHDFGSLLSWSPTGERVVIGDEHGRNSLWDAAGVKIADWTVAKPPGNAQLVWSSDGERLLTADGSSLVWRAADSGAPWGREPGVDFPWDRIDCGSTIVSMALHRDGEIVATGHTTELVQVWSMWTGELQWTARFPHPWGWCDPAQQDEEDTRLPDCDVAALAFSPVDDRLALSTRESAYVYVLDGLKGEKLWTSEWLGGHFFEVMQLVWSPKGERLWFSWECGWTNLYSVKPCEACPAQAVFRSTVPRFGRNAGVMRYRDLVVKINNDGGWSW